MTTLNNNPLYIKTNVRDSATVAYHKLCDPNSSSFDLGCTLRQETITPKSRTLEPVGVLDLTGLFFTFRSFTTC